MIHLESSTRKITEEEKRKLNVYTPKQELPTWAIVLISIGMVVSIIAALYIVRRADGTTRVRPL